jgi:acetolactate decarboxylase
MVFVAIGFVTIVLFAGFYQLTRPEQHTLYQISTFNIFATGNFEENTTYAELAKHGDFGIGNLNGLNGEMFAENGKFYQIPADGSPREIGALENTSYATVTFFNKDQTLQVSNISTY